MRLSDINLRRVPQAAGQAASAVPVRVDPRAVLFMAAGAGLATVFAPATVTCAACVTTAGAVQGAAWYGLTRAVERKNGTTTL